MAKQTQAFAKAKQTLLDIENPTTAQWSMQQILLLSKTETLMLQRQIKKLYATLYKTTARQLTLEDLYLTITEAAKLQTADDEVENKS